MSSILKALRKLEKENAWRREGTLDIARDVLRHPARRRTASRPVKTILAVVVFLIGAPGYGLSGLLAPASQPTPALAQAPAEEILPATAAIIPAGPVAGGEPIAPPASRPQPEPPVVEEIFRPDQPVGIHEQKPTGRTVARPAPTARYAPAAVSRETPQPPQVFVATPEGQKTTTLPPPAAADLPSAEVAGGEPALIVTGIAYQDDPQARLAVVNGLPVMAGTVIEGAVVEEILKDAVRFSRAGRIYEINLKN